MKAGGEKGKQVETTAAIKSHQDIHQCRDTIAHEWYYACASIGSFQLDRTEALEKFSKLTDQVIAFLMAENPERDAAREIGAELASLPCIDPRVGEISGQLWARHLDEGVFPVQAAVIYPRLLNLLNGMWAGFDRRAREQVPDPTGSAAGGAHTGAAGKRAAISGDRRDFHRWGLPVD
jgi:hypothetical protein